MTELRGRVFAAASRSVVPRLKKKSLLSGHDVGLFSLPNVQGGLLDGTGNENVRTQGSRDLNLTFMHLNGQRPVPCLTSGQNAIPDSRRNDPRQTPHRGVGDLVD